uniref:Uncharacterized protein n=1 Tax=Anguilla anguilla TaxID=7936 RepID=A0A0E9TLP8_ANGAN
MYHVTLTLDHTALRITIGETIAHLSCCIFTGACREEFHHFDCLRTAS